MTAQAFSVTIRRAASYIVCLVCRQEGTTK